MARIGVLPTPLQGFSVVVVEPPDPGRTRRNQFALDDASRHTSRPEALKPGIPARCGDAWYRERSDLRNPRSSLVKSALGLFTVQSLASSSEDPSVARSSENVRE